MVLSTGFSTVHCLELFNGRVRHGLEDCNEIIHLFRLGFLEGLDGLLLLESIDMRLMVRAGD